MKTFLSPRELSSALGVSESSIKRWVDEGLIASSKTAGGHRRIKVCDAVAFVRRHGIEIADRALLGLSAVHGSSGDSTDAIHHSLMSGSHQDLERLLIDQYSSGTSVAEICDGPLRSAFHTIGELWQHQDDGIMIEHRAVDCCLQALGALRKLLPTPPAHAPCAVGGAPPGDPYLLPSIMASMVLCEAGWRTVNLGPNTPWASMVTAVEQMSARLLWIAVSAPLPLSQTQVALPHLALVRSKGVQITVGGRRADTLDLSNTGAEALASLTDLQYLVHGAVAAHNGDGQ